MFVEIARTMIGGRPIKGVQLTRSAKTDRRRVLSKDYRVRRFTTRSSIDATNAGARRSVSETDEETVACQNVQKTVSYSLTVARGERLVVWNTSETLGRRSTDR